MSAWRAAVRDVGAGDLLTALQVFGLAWVELVLMADAQDRARARREASAITSWWLR